MEKRGMIMADVAYELMIKYGLAARPSDDIVREWARLTRKNISIAWPPEQAGERAAKLFADYNTRTYASQAHELIALLEAAEAK
jgi:hypothetical protein